MKLFIPILFVLFVVIVECKHTFLGTNVLRPLVFHYDASYKAKAFRKRIEYVNYTLPYIPSQPVRAIQGIMAYDLTYSGATANVTGGGLGTNFVNLRMKSDRGEAMHFDINIYA